MFVLPFVVAVIWLGLKFLFRREDRTLENFTYLFGFELFFGAAFLTGNVIDSTQQLDSSIFDRQNWW